MYEIMTLGAIPYVGMKSEAMFELLKGRGTLEKPNGCPSNVYELMKRCWSWGQSERPSFQELIDWLSRLQDEKEEVSWYIGI